MHYPDAQNMFSKDNRKQSKLMLCAAATPIRIPENEEYQYHCLPLKVPGSSGAMGTRKGAQKRRVIHTEESA